MELRLNRFLHILIRQFIVGDIWEKFWCSTDVEMGSMKPSDSISGHGQLVEGKLRGINMIRPFGGRPNMSVKNGFNGVWIV